MPNLNNAVARLSALLTPPIDGTNETKIFEPLPEDPNAELKTTLIDHAARTIRLAYAAIESEAVRSVQLLDSSLFLQLEGLPDSDAEKPDYFELINASQAVLKAINESAS